MRRCNDLMAIPHGHSTSAGLHFSLVQSPLLTPIQEYLVKWNAINQHFLANPVTPQHGEFTRPHRLYGLQGRGDRTDQGDYGRSRRGRYPRELRRPPARSIRPWSMHEA